jgi:hypothetical protein
MGLAFHSAGEEAKMQNLHDFQRDLSAESIDAVGGELLAGSDFETEEPEPGFAAAELSGGGVTTMAAITSPLTEHQQPDKPALRDFRQEVTDNIIGMLERGVAPWQKPSEPGAGSLGIPFNPTSERAYRGGNAIHLMATGLQRGYEDSRWMTYKQASDNGWQVRRGEKGTPDRILGGQRCFGQHTAIPTGRRQRWERG